MKAVAPGAAQAVRVTIPAGVNAIGIVGVKQDIDTRSARASFTTPGRPVAIVSNLRIEYTVNWGSQGFPEVPKGCR